MLAARKNETCQSADNDQYEANKQKVFARPDNCLEDMTYCDFVFLRHGLYGYCGLSIVSTCESIYFKISAICLMFWGNNCAKRVNNSPTSVQLTNTVDRPVHGMVFQLTHYVIN